MSENRRYRVDVNCPALATGLDSAWIVQETTPAAQPPPAKAKIKAHQWLALVWCVSGSSNNISSGERQYSRKHLTVVPPGMIAMHQPTGRSPLILRYITVRGPMIDRWLQSLQECDCGLTATTILRIPRIEALMLALTDPDLLDHDPGGWRWSKVLMNVIQLVDHELRMTDGQTAEVLHLVRTLVDEAPSRNWQLADLSRKTQLPPRTLSRHFQASTGVPIMRWVRERRMYAAQTMLASGMSVTAVADQMGASSPYNFSRAFKAVMGITPSELHQSMI